MDNIVINVKELNKIYGTVKVVNNLDMQVKEGECLGVLGPNGAGKTTTMKMLYGKLAPTHNEGTLIDVFGYDPRNKALDIKFISGIVPQQDNLDIDLNVRDNLIIYSKFYGMRSKDSRAKIQELLEFMELQEKAKSRVKELSGGMQRRLTIARALINDPKLLFLDEPTTGLDPQVRHLIWRKLRELKAKGSTILLTTHYMEEAAQICDRVIIMDKGRKLLEGSPKQLITQNIERYVMEARGEHTRRNEYMDHIKSTGVRCEFSDETLIAYSNELDALNNLVQMLEFEDCDIRRSNLEDLFLKVTGRSLNELQ